MKQRRALHHYRYGIQRPEAIPLCLSEMEWELLMRQSHGLPSRNDFIVDKLFPPETFDLELKFLRIEQRRMGIKDSEFWTTKKRKIAGLLVKKGRRRTKTGITR